MEAPKRVQLGVLALLVFIAFCGKGGGPKYKELRFRIEERVKIPEIFLYDHAEYHRGKVYFSQPQKGVWEFDVKKKKSRKIFRNGRGPEEVLAPNKIHCYGTACFINSYYPQNFLYKFSIKKEKLQRIKLPFSVNYDDFAVNSRRIILLNPYWRDGYLRIMDRFGGVSLKCGRPKVFPLMYRFNVNQGILSVSEGKIYAAFSAEAKVKIFTMDCKEKGTLLLFPPFYKKMPKKYKVRKGEMDEHRKWMGKWTRLYTMINFKKWLLVSYRRGYKPEFYYVLIDLDNPYFRFYSKKVSFEIFKVSVDMKFSGVLIERGELFYIEGKFILE